MKLLKYKKTRIILSLGIFISTFSIQKTFAQSASRGMDIIPCVEFRPSKEVSFNETKSLEELRESLIKTIKKTMNTEPKDLIEALLYFKNLSRDSNFLSSLSSLPKLIANLRELIYSKSLQTSFKARVSILPTFLCNRLNGQSAFSEGKKDSEIDLHNLTSYTAFLDSKQRSNFNLIGLNFNFDYLPLANPAQLTISGDILITFPENFSFDTNIRLDKVSPIPLVPTLILKRLYFEKRDNWGNQMHYALLKLPKLTINQDSSLEDFLKPNDFLKNDMELYFTDRVFASYTYLDGFLDLHAEVNKNPKMSLIADIITEKCFNESTKLPVMNRDPDDLSCLTLNASIDHLLFKWIPTEITVANTNKFIIPLPIPYAPFREIGQTGGVAIFQNATSNHGVLLYLNENNHLAKNIQGRTTIENSIDSSIDQISVRLIKAGDKYLSLFSQVMKNICLYQDDLRNLSAKTKNHGFEFRGNTDYQQPVELNCTEN